MQSARRIAGWTLMIWLLVPVSTPAAEAAREGPELLAHLPRDPLFVGVTSGENLAGTYDELLGLFAKIGDEDDVLHFRESLAELDDELGCSLRDDLLAGLGSELALVIDLPPVDEWMAAMMAPGASAATVMGRMGLLTSVRETERFETCLRKLLGQVDGVEFLAGEEMVEVRFPVDRGSDDPDQGGGAATPDVSIFYAFAQGLFALGADPAWVMASLEPRPAGEKVADGSDFARVFSHLDAAPQSLTYLNLPKLRAMVESSTMLQGMIDSDQQTRSMVDLFLAPEFTAMGMGSTAVSADGGTRRMSFGPPALSGGTALIGMMAATAIPNLLNATDRGRQKRSMADIRSVGTAVEMYAIDTNGYPTSGGAWVPVEKLEPSLSPVYIHELPQVDGWGHRLMYWSDGDQYRIASPGRDGEMSRDWSGTIEPSSTSEFEADIVFADGSFVAWPEGRQR